MPSTHSAESRRRRRPTSRQATRHRPRSRFGQAAPRRLCRDRKSTRLNSSHLVISYAVFCLEKKSTRLNSSHLVISYAVFCLKQKSTRLNSSHLVISYAVFWLNKKSMNPNFSDLVLIKQRL